MKKILVLSSLVLAASLVASPLAFAQDAPSAAVKAAICASASTDAVSFPADGRVANAATRDATAKAEVVKANVSAKDSVPIPSPTVENVRARVAELKDFLANDPRAQDPATRALHQEFLRTREAQLSALVEQVAAAAELRRAQAAQEDAVALEADVKTFVGTREFGVVKTELCTTPAPTPTPTPAPTPAPGVDLDCNDFPLAGGRTAQGVLNADPTDPHHLDVDGDKLACEIDQPAGNGPNAGGDFSQVGELPSAIDTGRA